MGPNDSWIFHRRCQARYNSWPPVWAIEEGREELGQPSIQSVIFRQQPEGPGLQEEASPSHPTKGQIHASLARSLESSHGEGIDP